MFMLWKRFGWGSFFVKGLWQSGGSVREKFGSAISWLSVIVPVILVMVIRLNFGYLQSQYVSWEFVSEEPKILFVWLFDCYCISLLQVCFRSVVESRIDAVQLCRLVQVLICYVHLMSLCCIMIYIVGCFRCFGLVCKWFYTGLALDARSYLDALLGIARVLECMIIVIFVTLVVWT